ncbi:MAG: fused isobutyryl-CoA mutase/GTPase IcmF [Desulfomonilia bacterium]|nr:methylmalonyl-CoA mutase family protein [Pseudomonadota bacterium]HPD20917.1 methylmalonyl-CoA mutase family protein [Deltaproteobacteria bacterium]HPX17744.1 methylmalonyl-CoA mutase family protein [Deltaproteobacteria bacterium]HRV35331.1 methylmalonyl-CoA mutase family protein [Desulfomonilia bacterium]
MKTRLNPKEPVRFVTATSLFDGHDASINIMRRILQDSGAEVIHLGHNRSVNDIVNAAIQEGAHAVAVSSYQGGHLEFFKYLIDLLRKRGCGYVKVFGGGGGVIVPEEIRELQDYGVAKIFSPEDGKAMGLKGMIDYMITLAGKIEFPPVDGNAARLRKDDHALIGRIINLAERSLCGIECGFDAIRETLGRSRSRVPVVGITGTGGAGKSSLTDELVRRFLNFYPERTIAIVSVDPSRSKSGGALLGDRIRMNHIDAGRVYMRSMATRGSRDELSEAVHDAILVLSAAGFDLIIVETSGIGQGNAAVTSISDLSLYVMTSEYGAPTQLEKIDMLDFADMVIINKFENEKAEDALKQVQKQYMRNHGLFGTDPGQLPVFGTVANRFNDPGINRVFSRLVARLVEKGLVDWEIPPEGEHHGGGLYQGIVPMGREHYLREIAEAVRGYHADTRSRSEHIRKIFSIQELLKDTDGTEAAPVLKRRLKEMKGKVPSEEIDMVEKWEKERKKYLGKTFTYTVRDKKIEVPLVQDSLSGLPIPRISLPAFTDPGDLYAWLRKENVPGRFPYTAGVFPFKRRWEEPKRQFAGEGSPERTNRRFHYLCRNDDAKRLSTAFDSVTLYGEDPHEEPDIFGKIGESGVSICTLDDMKKLYAGFDLCAPSTSVSMTINGPAPIMTAMFFNTAIDQQVDRFKEEKGRLPNRKEREEIRSWVLKNVRGTVQADILKEDQGQNTCIFSTEFALKMMGDIQEYFIEHEVNNFYSVSISGYHIAEAGANPISQLAFTLANGFTYVEYYLSRGMKIDDFAGNFSFFFSSGMDPEYSVIGRVARRIWAIAMRDLYGANELSQRLKYHIQTSGRSLHSMEIQFNDIRTTLQALTALEDNCNSLHTNSYDEAITTPTEESVRRAMAIQLIINREFGPSINENKLQGSFFIDWLTDAVEEAVLKEFERISDRKGVLGAMEMQYQRSKIQEESLYYEELKHTGRLPIIGVNTFENPNATGEDHPGGCIPLTRATPEEKMGQLTNLRKFQALHAKEAPAALEKLKKVALQGGNIFAELMETVRVASLGQITRALYEVGGKYRRNM